MLVFGNIVSSPSPVCANTCAAAVGGGGGVVVMGVVVYYFDKTLIIPLSSLQHLIFGTVLTMSGASSRQVSYMTCHCGAYNVVIY